MAWIGNSFFLCFTKNGAKIFVLQNTFPKEVHQIRSFYIYLRNDNIRRLAFICLAAD